MRKFRRIVIRPMTDFNTLELKVANRQGWDLTDRSPDDVKKILDLAISIAAKTPGVIMASSRGGEQFVNTSFRAAEGKNNYVSFPEPNPICIYYKSANDHLERSLAFRKNLLNKDQLYSYDYQYEMFVNYFQEASEGITLLSKTIEGFINQLIPEKTDIEIQGRKGKDNLEWLPIGSKLRELMVALGHSDFNKSHTKEYSNITNMIALRDDLVHLKTAAQENKTVYQSLYKRVIDFDHYSCSNSVFIFINTMAPGYFIEEHEAIDISKKAT